ncbi:ATP-binding protein [Thiovibrio frasassiensis]|uniref:ATP-binding protein n=1 Tax=Thiovibrio frasassiensis TaxID=2984131 RepID=A0A9X4MHF7_9BACT|nr:ATP-binding protein [Thiovibrio frasassiensis]MDG4475603.1 ATP-binding protein [Thiovibrio frasassiensis]
MSSNTSEPPDPPEEKYYEECPSHGPWLRSVYNQEKQEWLAVTPIGCPACRRDTQLQTLLQRTLIPPRFANCTFDTFSVELPEQEAALYSCRKYADDFKQMHEKGVCMVLQGNVGTGKNHLACAIARQVSQQGYSSLLLTVAEVIQRVRATWDPQSSEKETEIIERFADVDLLILDEVGRQYGSGAEKITLFQVIDARYRAMRPTIVISNLLPTEMGSYLGGAAYDRLRENHGVLVEFYWESHRGRRQCGE